MAEVEVVEVSPSKHRPEPSQDQKLDPHAKPPDALKTFYKGYQKLKSKDIDHDDRLIDFRRPERYSSLRVVHEVYYQDSEAARNGEVEKDGDDSLTTEFLKDSLEPVKVYEHDDMPGLRMIPGLLPPSSQKSLLNKLIHRDVSNPTHQSNLHLHYNISYPPSGASFFSIPPPSLTPLLTPKDPSIHKPLTISQMLTKKLRWITLGGQYDWTNKIYPSSTPPAFPGDIAEFLRFLFPKIVNPQAAIVNFYSPGDTLSLHRDVAESCDRGLVSLSIGCEGIFVLGHEDAERPEGVKMVAMRLRSGDAVVMDGESRYAWHGVPLIVKGSCPEWLGNWPGDEFEEWRGWMEGKRVNLNVRQMRE